MSYVKVQNISIKKDGKITMTAADSNVRPVRYRTEEIFKHSDLSFQEKIKMIFEDLIGRNLQFNDSSKSKVFYAYLRAFEHFNEKYDYSIMNIWRITDEDKSKVSEWEAERIMAEMYEKFQIALMEPVNLSEKKYAVRMDDGYLHKINEQSYRWSRTTPKYLTINTALAYKLEKNGEIEIKEDK